MSQKFQASVQHRGDTSFVKLGGVIDEDNELSDLVDKIPSGTAVIDLGEIERINSCGVRDWVNWLSRLESNGTRSVLVECSPAIVAQINLVSNFTANGVVKSFYVPYFCPECDEEKVLLVEAQDMGPPPHEPPTCRCDECDLVMDFDDMPDSYFAFLSNQRKLADPIRGSGALASGPEGHTGKSKVRSRSSQAQMPSGGGTNAGAGPSVPSLPSIRSSAAPNAAHQSGGPRLSARSPMPAPANTSSPSGPRLSLGNAQVSGQHPVGMPMRMQPSAQALEAPGKSNAVIFVLVGVLVAAIAVLAYLVLAK